MFRSKAPMSEYVKMFGLDATDDAVCAGSNGNNRTANQPLHENSSGDKPTMTQYEGGSSEKLHTMQHESGSSEKLTMTQSQNLCKRCVDALRRGKYVATRLDISVPTKLRGCDMCHTRTHCGVYTVRPLLNKPSN